MSFVPKIVCFVVLTLSFVFSAKGESQATIFEKLHDDVTQIQNYAHGKAHEINSQLLNELNAIYLSLLHKRGQTINDIQEESQNILKRLKLSEDEPKIRECLKIKNSSIVQLTYETIGASSICRILTEDKKLEANKFIDELYSRQYREHLELENVRKVCNNTKNEENCILQNLIGVRAPSIRVLGSDTEIILQKFKENLTYLEDNYRYCMERTEDEILGGGRNNILQIFEECCKN